MKIQPYNEYFPIVKLYEEISGKTKDGIIKNNDSYDSGLKQMQRLIERTFGKGAKIPIQLKDFYVDYFKPIFATDKFSDILNKIDKNKPTSGEENILLAEHFYKCLEKVQEEHLKRYLADRFLFKYSRQLDSKLYNILKNIDADLDLLTGLNVYQDALDLAQEYEEIIKNATENWKEKVSSKIEDEERYANIIEGIKIKRTIKKDNGEKETVYSLASEDIKKFKSISADQYRKMIADSQNEYDIIIREAFDTVRENFVFSENPKPIKRQN